MRFSSEINDRMKGLNVGDCIPEAGDPVFEIRAGQVVGQVWVFVDPSQGQHAVSGIGKRCPGEGDTYELRAIFYQDDLANVEVVTEAIRNFVRRSFIPF